MRQRLRLFFTAFFCTLCACVLLYGFFLADANTRETGLRENEPLLSVAHPSPLIYEVRAFGESAVLSLAPLNEAARVARHAFCFLPAELRLALRLGAV